MTEAAPQLAPPNPELQRWDNEGGNAGKETPQDAHRELNRGSICPVDMVRSMRIRPHIDHL
jgi:hypothetical protein